ncbi:MAG: glycoside hydrolase family 65 protein [Ornithinibacter sp.]
MFQLLQATGRVEDAGVPAKGLTGQAYEGHYFWDMEVYVMPFLIYTAPRIARNLLKFRYGMLDKARERARELNQQGALFPWRTINGDEASAYYAAGTAQYHIDAAIGYAIKKYVDVTGDVSFLADYGAEMLVETARLWYDLGFFSPRQNGKFCIHGVTGPDEYTTVVNNNLFTNVMARYNLEQAVQWVQWTREQEPEEYARIAQKLQLTDREVTEWAACAEGMHIPFDDGLQIHPQDDFFLDREVWDLSRTPEELRPLLLHYHPLVIYRFQVLKQADVVLALFLQGNRFTAQEKRLDFEYYDPITTGDSTLSAVVQSVIAAEVGYHEVAYGYFLDALYVDLANAHDNTVDGLHVASTGGVWSALVNGFGGMRDHDGRLSFDPRLPDGWHSLAFRVTWRGTRVRVTLTPTELAFDVEAGELPVPVDVQGTTYAVDERERVVIALDGHGPRIPGTLGNRPQTGGTRADGSRITAGVPSAIPLEGEELPEAVPVDLSMVEPATVGPD